jgi:dynein heavy chain
MLPPRSPLHLPPLPTCRSCRLYITTRQANPEYSPELQSKVTIVDFTVTAQGLEDQLLGIVIQHEQTALEEQMRALITDVNVNTKARATCLDPKGTPVLQAVHGWTRGMT